MNIQGWLKWFNQEIDRILTAKVGNAKLPQYTLEYIEIPGEFWDLLLKDETFKRIVDGKHERWAKKIGVDHPVTYPNIGGYKVVKGDKLQAHATENVYK